MIIKVPPLLNLPMSSMKKGFKDKRERQLAGCVSETAKQREQRQVYIQRRCDRLNAESAEEREVRLQWMGKLQHERLAADGAEMTEEREKLYKVNCSYSQRWNVVVFFSL